ncbi:MAG: VOC family protein [Armatimonadetes bacterium]|nr:VOC family protein [Armatimonadota bacterium]
MTPFIDDIDHVQLAAPEGCEEAARQFFGHLLGLQEIEKPDELRARGGCWFQLGPTQIHVGVEKDFQPAKKAHPAFSCQILNGLYERLAQAGIECEWDTTRPDIRRFYCRDPWGNRLEFTEPTRLPS